MGSNLLSFHPKLGKTHELFLKLSISLLWALEETQHLASIGARRNSASRFYWRSKKLSISLLLALEETQHLASIGAR
ncbi:hypothetical protein LEP1GSC041_2288 [Leptospira noguchii str. 2006001870]|nr:hypothetical protein LEP1GSC041_2288 [Leptospira noguchii str. 2006001870]